MGKPSREKGKRGELELMHILRDFYGYPVRRGYVFQHESDLVGLPGVHVECKRKEKINVYTDYKQAVREAQKRRDGAPVVFYRKSNEQWLVILGIEDFMDFYGGKYEHLRTDTEGEQECDFEGGSLHESGPDGQDGQKAYRRIEQPGTDSPE